MSEFDPREHEKDLTIHRLLAELEDRDARISVLETANETLTKQSDQLLTAGEAWQAMVNQHNEFILAVDRLFMSQKYDEGLSMIKVLAERIKKMKENGSSPLHSDA